MSREARIRLSLRELELLEAALTVYLDGLEGAVTRRHAEHELQLLRLRLRRAQLEAAAKVSR